MKLHRCYGISVESRGHILGVGALFPSCGPVVDLIMNLLSLLVMSAFIDLGISQIESHPFQTHLFKCTQFNNVSIIQC